MIRIYQGIDIVEVSKLRKILQKNPAFAAEVFTEKERAYCMSHKNHIVHMAGRLAAKEACLKALGTGLSGISGSLLDIEISNLPSGRPELRLSGWIGRLGRKKKISEKTVSISHSGSYAVASVIMLGDVV